MTPALAAALDLAPGFVLILARVGATMTVLPGLGEAVAPAAIRIGLALSITILLLPGLKAEIPPIPATGMEMGLMVAGEVITGLWFGWIARMIVLALPMCAQFIGFLIGLSSVLQPDPEIGAQSNVLGKLFELLVPVVLLAANLYRPVLSALGGLFILIPAGHMLPAADGTEMALRAVATSFKLALQLASPFVVMGIVWHLSMGVLARIVSRMQIYFVSVPGQIIAGLAALTLVTSTIIWTWRDATETFLMMLPGSQ